MKEKEVILIRKQNTPFIVNFPIDGRIKKYIFTGTKGKLLNKKSVPFEVYDWLATNTSTFEDGMLIIDKTDDKDINEIKENIDKVENVEKSILTENEIIHILTTGNHNALKKELTKVTKGLTPELVENQKKYVVQVASNVGVDSGAKRKVICEWANLDYENSDLIFDKDLKSMYDKESK